MDQAYEDECAVLGALLADESSFFRLPKNFSGDDFSDPGNGEVFDVIKRLVLAGIKPEPGLVAGEVGIARAELYTMMRSIMSTANINLYAERVAEQATRRRISALALGERSSSEIFSALSKIQKPCNADVLDFHSLIDQTDAVLEEEKRRYNGSVVKGIATTLPTLDELLKGFYGAQMYVLGGRPGRFKSVFALQVLLMAGRPCAMFSLEMSAVEIGKRIKQRGVPKKANLKVYFDCVSYTMDQIETQIIEWVNGHGVELVVIDHIQLVKIRGARNRFEELAEISRRCKQLTLRLKIPLILVSQISRDVERARRFPQLSDLRECGNLEQDADVVFFIHAHRGADLLDDDDYCIVVAKNRNGQIGNPFPVQVFGEHAAVAE